MKDRKSRIITGCGFLAELVRQNKTQSATFKTAGKRLVELINAELAGETDTDLAQEIFQPKS